MWLRYASDGLMYSDTDLVYTVKPLSSDLISENELGKKKVEFIADEAVFRAGMAYSLLNKDGTSYIKIKGSKIRGLINI